MRTSGIIALVVVALLTNSCATTIREREYMAIGAGAGVVTIALLGTPFSGVVIGAAAGGAAGYAYSKHEGNWKPASAAISPEKSEKSGNLRDPHKSPPANSCMGNWEWDPQKGGWVCK